MAICEGDMTGAQTQVLTARFPVRKGEGRRKPAYGQGKHSIRLYAGRRSRETRLSPLPPKGGVLRARAITESRKESGFTLKKKTTIITARLTPSEKAAIKKRARKAKMTMTDYIVQCALGKEIVRVDGLGEILSELKGQGRNLNQLTMLANMGRISVVQGEDLVMAYGKMCSQLEEIVGEVER